MDIFINKLPDDIIQYIIPYTYQLQNKPLLNDIKNYKETKDIISELYYNYWILGFGEIEPEDKYWIINDLVAFANNYQATMYGYVEQFYNIFRRNLHLQTYEEIDVYLSVLQNKPVDSQINIIWSLLTPSERTEFIDIFQQEQNNFIY